MIKLEKSPGVFGLFCYIKLRCLGTKLHENLKKKIKLKNTLNTNMLECKNSIKRQHYWQLAQLQVGDMTKNLTKIFIGLEQMIILALK